MVQRILGMVGWLGTALVFAAVAARFLRPETPELYNRLALAGLVCVLLYILSQWRDILKFFTRRQARFGTLTTLSVVVVLAILIGINYVAARQNVRWDLTASSVFTLSDQTTRVLRELEQPLQIKVFGREDQFDQIRLRLNEYQYVNPDVQVEYVDLDRRPAEAEKYDVRAYGTIVAIYQDRVERTASNEEQDITNAIIKAVEGQQKKVYFVQGHGEKDPVSAERDGYNAIADAMTGDNFLVEKVVLAQQGGVPEDASVLVIAGPRSDFFPNELEMLRSYLSRGGKALFMIDPPDQADSVQLPELLALLQDWNVTVGNDVVVDASGMGQILGTDASVPVAAQYPPHPIVDRFGLITAYPLARSVTPITEGGSVNRIAVTFIETSPRSWAETDVARLMTTREVALDVGQGDREGPISIGVAVTGRTEPVSYTPTPPVGAPADPAAETATPEGEPPPAEQPEGEQNQEPQAEGTTGVMAQEAQPPEVPEPQLPAETTPADASDGGDTTTTGENAAGDDADDETRETRIAVIGDSDFAANFALGIQGNRDLFLNTVNWLAEQENLISIRPREPEDRRITLTADQQRRIFWLSVFIIPGMVLLTGVYTWWQRR